LKGAPLLTNFEKDLHQSIVLSRERQDIAQPELCRERANLKKDAARARKIIRITLIAPAD
jgi:hypothetical protein